MLRAQRHVAIRRWPRQSAAAGSQAECSLNHSCLLTFMCADSGFHIAGSPLLDSQYQTLLSRAGLLTLGCVTVCCRCINTGDRSSPG